MLDVVGYCGIGYPSIVIYECYIMKYQLLPLIVWRYAQSKKVNSKASLNVIVREQGSGMSIRESFKVKGISMLAC